MGFLGKLFKGRSAQGEQAPAHIYWIYAQCRRCGEPLKCRVDLRNEPSLDDDGESWIVRKGLIGSGSRRCFQTVEVTLKFDAAKKRVVESEVAGGKLVAESEYQSLARSS